MSAIAGYIGHGGGSRPTDACRAMLARLAIYGPHSQDSHSLGNAAFGRALYRVLPEDSFDEQPLVGGGGRYLLVADARIDNRGELANKLGLTPRIVAQMSDASLLLCAWERWQLASLDDILGDVALAVWDDVDRRLTLARSPIALKPLFYHATSKFLAFASMPQGLHALPEISRDINFEAAAAIPARLPILGTSTIFEGIRIVRHGQAVQIAGGKEITIPLWNLDQIEPGSIKPRDSAEALRAELDRSVQAQLRRSSGFAACQLSSGRDSSAVTTTAALALRSTGEQLLALTGAPQAGYSGPAVGNRLADESWLAAKTASFHPNITHVVCRAKGMDLGQEFRRLSERHFRPMTNAVALHWSAEVEKNASAEGASIMLMGSTGNFSISASGLSHFVDVLNHCGPMSWGLLAMQIGRLSLSNWRTIGSVSFGPSLSEATYKTLVQARRRATAGLEVPVLRQPFRQRVEALLRDQSADIRPPKSYHQFRKEMLLRRDNAEKMSLALSGLDVRDPTGDRRLVETCLAFAPDQLASRPGTPSLIYENAFSDRIPGEVLYNEHRGYQAADWFQLFPKEEVKNLFDTCRKNMIVEEMLDYEYIYQLIESWPRQATSNQLVLQIYRNQLLNALSLAVFIELYFPN